MSEAIRPVASAAAVTPSDTEVLTGVRGLWVGGVGNVAVLFPGASEAVTFTGVPAGSFLPIQAVKVMATNTTATAILALY